MRKLKFNRVFKNENEKIWMANYKDKTILLFWTEQYGLTWEII